MAQAEQPAAGGRPEGAQIAAEERVAARDVLIDPPHWSAGLMPALRDALVAAGLAGIIGLFFLYLRTDIAPGGLVITTRWTLWLSAMVYVFVGRLLLNVLLFGRHGTPTRLAAVGVGLGVLLVWLVVLAQSGGGMALATLLTHLILFALGVAVLFAVASWREGSATARAPTARVAATPRASGGLSLVRKAVAGLLLVLALALPFLLMSAFPNRDRQLIDLAILVMTYIMLGWGLNIVVGLAGLLDLGYVAFYAVGAYSFALLAKNFEFIGFWTALPLAGLLAALWGVILGFPVLRLRGDYLAIVTLAFGEIIRVVLLNWYDFTGGPNGISGIPKPTLFGYEFKAGEGGVAAAFGFTHDPIHRFIFLYYIILGLALLTNFVTMRLRRLPVGRAWEALREDEIACRSLGMNTTNTKLTAFALGAMFGGFAGSFFATRQGFISPESFTFLESAIILAIVVLGGLGSQIGVVLASLVMIVGIELLRNLSFLKVVFGPDFEPASYRMLIFGLAMVLIMVWKPRGLVASREPTAVLRERKVIGADAVAQGEGH